MLRIRSWRLAFLIQREHKSQNEFPHEQILQHLIFNSCLNKSGKKTISSRRIRNRRKSRAELI